MPKRIALKSIPVVEHFMIKRTLVKKHQITRECICHVSILLHSQHSSRALTETTVWISSVWIKKTRFRQFNACGVTHICLFDTKLMCLVSRRTFYRWNRIQNEINCNIYHISYLNFNTQFFNIIVSIISILRQIRSSLNLILRISLCGWPETDKTYCPYIVQNSMPLELLVDLTGS